MVCIIGSWIQNFLSSFYNDFDRPYQQMKMPIAYPAGEVQNLVR